MTLTKFVKWLGAGAAIVAIGAGVFGTDSVTHTPFGDAATSALAAAPDGGESEARLPDDPDRGLQWIPGDSNIYVAEAPVANTVQGENETFAQVNITVTYLNAYPPDAQVALERAVAIWESIIIGNGPISIEAYWVEDLSSLGRGGPKLHRDFPNAPLPGVWYPDALVNQIRGQDHEPSTFDIKLEVRSNPTQPWSYSAGPAPANTVDFTSVALHEIGHGLGFSDSFTNSPGPNVTFGLGTAPNSFPLLHDTFAVTNAGVQLITLTSGTPALTTATTNGGAYFSGANATAANGGVRPKLLATSPFTSSNISHLDEATYKGPPNSLMSPTFQGNETVREPGPIMRAILKDYGYQIADPAATPGTIQFLQTANSTSESVGTLNVPVTRANGSSGAATAECQVETGGTAANPADFTISTATVAWADGESGTKNCVLGIINDPAPEPDETINLKLANPTGATIATPSATSVKILANDQSGTLAFTSSTLTVEEDDSATNLFVSRKDGAQGAIGATCVVTGGSAVATTDFTISNTDLRWTDGGSTNQFCTITPVNNGSASGNKTVVIDLQGPTGSPALGSPSQITVTLADDDNAGTLQFLKKDFGSVSEDVGGYEFVVERLGGSSGAVSAVCAILPQGTTAILSDYNMVQAVVSWFDGEFGDRSCIVAVFDDDLGGEGDETVSLVLTPPFPGGAAAGPNLTATLAIEDNDPPLLIFTTQPGNGHTGLALDQQPVVEIQSALGDTLSDFDANVTLSLVVPSRSIFAPPTISCEPNPSATDGGVARFAGCVISGVHGGMELQLKATAPGMATALSAPFFIADTSYDATCDGLTTASDPLALLRALAGFTSGLLPVAPCTGDANDSGDASLFDALLMRLFVAGAP